MGTGMVSSRVWQFQDMRDLMAVIEMGEHYLPEQTSKVLLKITYYFLLFVAF